MYYSQNESKFYWCPSNNHYLKKLIQISINQTLIFPYLTQIHHSSLSFSFIQLLEIIQDFHCKLKKEFLLLETSKRSYERYCQNV